MSPPKTIKSGFSFTFLAAFSIEVKRESGVSHPYCPNRFGEKSSFELLKVDVTPDRFEQEVALLAQKSDIAEEYDRIKSHIKETRNILKKGGICGKRLDFMMQEFNREANTMASKASNLNITRVAVDLKVLIEQMREQIQNIE